MFKTNFCILFIIVSFFCTSKAEVYQFTFTGSGKSNSVEEVEVVNLTKGISKTLTGNDILQLGDVGASLPPGVFQLDNIIRIYPNPMHQSAIIDVSLPGISESSLNIFDLSGRSILQRILNLTEGKHQFYIQGLKAGIYFITLSGKDFKTSQRLIVNEQGVAFPSLGYNGQSNIDSTPKRIKNIESKVIVDYNEGDLVILKARSGNYSRIIVLNPKVKVQIINFHFLDCVDGSGNHYPVVTIGNQTWMAENLKTTKYRNGEVIPTTTYSIGAEVEPKYQWGYNNDENQVESYGRLYTWFTQADTREVLPLGWHVPSDEDWKQLEMYLGMSRGDADATTGQRGSTEGEKLKVTGFDYWLNSTGSTNQSGFFAKGAGWRSADGIFNGLKEIGCFWSGDEHTNTGSFVRSLSANKTTIERNLTDKSVGVSVRGILEASQESWVPVPEIDMSLLSTSDFEDNELNIPYYLKHLSTVANAVVETGPNRGFIDLHVYRSLDENVPINARIMENILSFVYFYITERPWNAYYGSPELKVRIEAAFEYLLSLQKNTGLFPDQTYTNGGMATTAFITKFIGETLVLLRKQNVPTINADLFTRVVEAERKAIIELLADDAQYAQGKNYANQYTNVYAGALAYLSLYEDVQMHQKLIERINQSAVDFQSPVGYFYESTGHGPDFGYNMNTHFSNLWMCYSYAKGTALAEKFQKEADDFEKWIKYNAVLESDGKTYTLNRAIATRTDYGVVEDWLIKQTPFGEFNGGIRAFIYSQDELRSEVASKRQELEANWPDVGNLTIGSATAYDPYTFLHREHYIWHANVTQKDSSINELPYLKYEQFNHQKRDSKTGSVFTYIKRPNYYAAFASGTKATGGQRFGLSLLWNQESGVFMQSINRSSSAAWGTIKSGATDTYEANISGVSFLIENRLITPTDGAKDLPNGQMIIQYLLGGTNTKKLTFNTDSIKVEVKHAGEFTEYIPLLVGKNDVLTISRPGFVTLRSGNRTIRIDHSTVVSRQVSTDIKAGDKTIVVLKLTVSGQLNYSITFN